VWVKRFIEMTGLSFKNNWESLPDHITIELELMQRLAAHEAGLWGPGPPDPSDDGKNIDMQLCRCLRAQEQFLREHLCVWVPKFCERVLEASAGRFYMEMAKLTESVVLSDVEQVAEAQSKSSLRNSSFAGCGEHDDPSPRNSN
jgi:TorA maturation chaperone TorD